MENKVWEFIKEIVDEFLLFFIVDVLLLLALAMWYSYDPTILDSLKSEPVAPLTFKDSLLIGIPAILILVFEIGRKVIKLIRRKK